jgi:hypothetical protein
MLDDFREQASASPFFEEEQPEGQKTRQPEGPYFLGMRPAQRFILALLLLVMTCLLGAFCLLATGRVVLPFF